MQLNIQKSIANLAPTISFKPKKQLKKKKGLSHTPKSFKNLYQSLKLKQIKPMFLAKEVKKGANQANKDLHINTQIPIYELSLNGITLDISNSVQYILNKFATVSDRNKKIALVYKIEFGIKTTFYKN